MQDKINRWARELQNIKHYKISNHFVNLWRIAKINLKNRENKIKSKIF